MNNEEGEADVPTISERAMVNVPTPEPKAKHQKDGTHGLIIGGPFENEVELDPELLKHGFVRGHKMRWHEYSIHDRGDGTKFFLYSGSRTTLNG